ncbi:MAG: clostripain-related cysteine peptidase [Elusimicrobia bacterium]|nr:clostripain-related cysteine peptidase [Elusimicrobiota bacterium]
MEFTGGSMIKRIAAVLAIMFSGGPWAFAGMDFDRGFDVKDALTGTDAPEVAVPAGTKGWFSHHDEDKPQPVKEWTVMVYMNGKNDLEVAGLYNVNKMELVGSGDSLNILTETGRMNGQQNDVHFDGDWTGSRRFYVTKDTDENRIKSKAVQTFDKVDMGDWRHLVDFAKWGMKNYPARHYALIVWNHGSGWVTTKAVSKGISYDFETKNHISTPELGAAMREIGKVDILAYDACLMQMAELVYEVKDHADYIVGSEETIPGLGFPYDAFLPAFASGSRSAGELAAGMVTAYDSFYGAKGKKVTLSAIDISALPGFMSAFGSWTDALLASDKKPQIKAKFYGAASYADKDNKDLSDFARLAAEADPALADSGRAMTDALDAMVIGNTAYKEGYGRDEASHGLAIYLPEQGYNEKYDQLAWARDTKWDDLLKEMKGVSAPGLEFMSGCVKPPEGASLQQLMAYLDCLTNALNASKP